MKRTGAGPAKMSLSLCVRFQAAGDSERANAKRTGTPRDIPGPISVIVEQYKMIARSVTFSFRFCNLPQLLALYVHLALGSLKACAAIRSGHFNLRDRVGIFTVESPIMFALQAVDN